MDMTDAKVFGTKCTISFPMRMVVENKEEMITELQDTSVAQAVAGLSEMLMSGTLNQDEVDLSFGEVDEEDIELEIVED